jgi:DNA-binding transcriptional LysR family regulator
MFDWDDLRLFLTVARTRKVAAAAKLLNVDATTISRRLARLAEQLGAVLFERVAGERLLTERGEALFSYAETMESAALAAMGDVAGETSRLSGQVRLSVAEGFGTWVLAPALQDFHAQHPHIRLDFITASGFLNPSKREADVAVMLARPRHGRLIAAKLGDYRLRLYASPAYLASRGAPRTATDLMNHNLVGYVPEFLYTPELDYLDEVSPGLQPSIRSTSINMQHRLVADGAGIGVLPNFVARSDANLEVVLPEIEVRRSYWLVTHADQQRIARIDAVAQWLRHCGRLLDRPE